MEHLEGRPLSGLLAGEGALSPERAVVLLEQVLSGLDRLHAAGLVQNSLDPQHLLHSVDPGGKERVRIFTLPLSLVFPSGSPPAGPEYVAPERLDGGAGDARSDVYAAGCLAYAMLSGGPPFIGLEMSVVHKHLCETPLPIREVWPAAKVSRRLEHVVMRALSKEPDARYSSATDMRQALLFAAAVGPTEPEPPPAAARVRLGVSGPAVAVAVAIVAAALAYLVR